MKIFSLVVTYNGAKWIAGCLDSLKASSTDNEIIVVDNGSTDRTKTIVRESYPEVFLLENADNLGFGQANNQGLRMALEIGRASCRERVS
jgi:GT2 family glycosyltransferase